MKRIDDFLTTYAPEAPRPPVGEAARIERAATGLTQGPRKAHAIVRWAVAPLALAAGVAGLMLWQRASVTPEEHAEAVAAIYSAYSQTEAYTATTTADDEQTGGEYFTLAAAVSEGE